MYSKSLSIKFFQLKEISASAQELYNWGGPLGEGWAIFLGKNYCSANKWKINSLFSCNMKKNYLMEY